MLASQSLKFATLGAVLSAALMLSACGYNQGDRALSGAAIGAGAGAAVGSLYGDVGTGAVIGGAAGGAIGAFSDPCQINLGHPFWRARGVDEYNQRCGQ